MKLVEFKIGHAATGAPGHGNAVATGAVRIAGIEVGFACTTGCQYHEPGLEQLYTTEIVVEFCFEVPEGVDPDAMGAGYLALYRSLWDEDEGMMQLRGFTATKPMKSVHETNSH